MMQYIDTTLIRKFQQKTDELVIIESLYNGRTGTLREMVELEKLDDDLAWENGRQVIGALDLCEMIHAVQIDHPEFGENIYLDFTEGKQSLTGLRVLSPNDENYPDTLTPLLDHYYQPHRWEEIGTAEESSHDHGTIYHPSYDVWEEKVITNNLWQNRLKAGRHTSEDLTTHVAWNEEELAAVPDFLQRVILPGRELAPLEITEPVPCYLREDYDDGTVEMTIAKDDSAFVRYRLIGD